MHDVSIGLERSIGIWISGVSYTKWLQALLDCIFIQSYTKMIFPISTDSSIDIQITWRNEVSGINYVIVSG